MSESESLAVDMDKKSSGRAPLAQPKGNGADFKKDSHASKNGKGGYKRENNGPKPRNDQNRKPYSQKSRPIDRRPRPRESYNNRQGEEVTDEYGAGDSSVLKLGNKKQNLNHLLNFSVASRETDSYAEYGGYVPPSTGARGKRWNTKKRAIRYNKEQFLQANCQFVVKEGDYTVHSVDPDTLVDWDHIEQIRIYSNEVPSCPICLYPPVAAKITRCGHTYCWRCMLHYLSLSEKKTWRKCPICYEAVHQKDLKSVCALETRSYKVGEEITLRLMRREKDSTYVMPADQWQDCDSKPHNVTDGVELAFCKLLMATPDDVQAILDCERTALETQLAEEGESLEGSYVKAAMELQKERQVSVHLSKAAKDSAHEKLEALGRQDSTKPTPAQQADNSFAPLRKDVVEYSSAFSDEEVDDSEHNPDIQPANATPPLQADSRTMSESSDDTQSQPSPELQLPSNTMHMTTADGEKIQVSVEEAAEELVMPAATESPERTDKRTNAFFFYQASDGQQIYLHSLNARCLVKEYGSLEHCPRTLTARIIEMEGISMNEELRRRLRYLGHLPLTCEFTVAELAIKPPVVSKETLHFFADDIEKRRRQRQRKSRDERRQLRKMQQNEQRKYEHCPEMRMLLDTHHFPESSSTIVRSEMPSLLGAGQSVSPAVSTPDLLTPVGSPSSVDLATSPNKDDGGQASMSFAQMLRAGKVKQSKSGWPKTGVPSTAAGWGPAGSEESDSEDRVPVPLYRKSFGDAIKAALEKHDKQPGSTVAVETSIQEVGADTSGVGGKKKKKQKKTLLFTTSMARSK